MTNLKKYGKKLFLIILLSNTVLCIPCIVFSQTIENPEDKDDYLETIAQYFRDEDWDSAKDLLDKSLKKYPRDSDLRMQMGKYYFEKKWYDKARYELVKALEYNKNNLAAKHLLVNVEIESARYSSAICYINELLEVNPYWKGLWIKKIEAYRLQGNQAEANRLLKRLSQIYPEDNEIRTSYLYYVEEEAQEKARRGELHQAIDLSTHLTEISPENENLYLDLVNQCLKAGDFSKALMNCDRGLNNLPTSLKLIDKKADILAGQQRYEEVFEFIQLKKKEGVNNTYLEQRYNYFLSEAARSYRRQDPYTLYSMVYDRNPRNEEALRYVVNTAITNGMYDDALMALAKAKAHQGETRWILLKEREAYKQSGSIGKADQILNRLYDLFPEDTDILSEYTDFRYRQGKEAMAEERWAVALKHMQFVEDNGDDEFRQIALVTQYNCYFELENYNQALITTEKLMDYYPGESDWHFKRSAAWNKQRQYREALREYKKGMDLTPDVRKVFYMAGYEELALLAVKELLEAYKPDEAQELVVHWMDTNPESKDGLHYAVNIASQVGDYESFYYYASRGVELHPDEQWFKIKLSEAYNLQKEAGKSYHLLLPEVERSPWHKELTGAFSESGMAYAKELMKERQYDAGLTVLNNSLLYDPDNKELKYLKGLTFEKLKQTDSAYVYQSYYEPSLLEYREFSGHLNQLKNKGYKNKGGLFYLRSRHNDTYEFTSVSTVEYIRFEEKNNYTGRINYTGRAEGKGIQGEFEWSHYWRSDLYSRIHTAVANKYFSSFIIDGSLYKSFENEWQAEAGLGYRRISDKKNMVNCILGVTKEIDPWWLNSRVNMLILDKRFYYSVLAQARFMFNHPGTYVTAMGSIGSAPDVEILDYNLYNGFSVTNSMVGAGITHLLTNNVSVGILGTCYNYKEASGTYRNLYNIYVQLYVSF